MREHVECLIPSIGSCRMRARSSVRRKYERVLDSPCRTLLGILAVPPMAPVVLLGERGDFGRSPIYSSSWTSLRLSLVTDGVLFAMHKEELRT
jgi:hypothetical protein